MTFLSTHKSRPVKIMLGTISVGLLLLLIVIYSYVFIARPRWQLCHDLLFPSFRTKEELIQSQWGTYFDYVYGLDTIPEKAFPLDTHMFNYFYRKKLPEVVKTYVDKLDFINKSPAAYGDLYTRQTPTKGYCKHSEIWIYQYPFAPYSVYVGGALTRLLQQDKRDVYPNFIYNYGFRSHTKVEIMHYNTSGSYYALWMYLAVGSGVYLDVGNTIAFREHKHAFDFFEVDDWADCIIAARIAKYDTIQCTHHLEGFFKYEFIQINALPTDTATGCFPIELSTAFSGGYEGNTTCSCHPNNHGRINCDGRRYAFTLPI